MCFEHKFRFCFTLDTEADAGAFAVWKENELLFAKHLILAPPFGCFAVFLRRCCDDVEVLFTFMAFGVSQEGGGRGSDDKWS
jgi:hypothetical protein